MVGILLHKCTVKRAHKTCNLFCNIQCCKTRWKLSDVARFTDYENLATLYCWKTGSNVLGYTRNIASQLVLQQCCKTSCRFFVPSLLSFTAKQGIFQKKAPQVSILLRLSYRFPRVIEIIFLFPSKVKFDEVNILIVPQSLDQLRSRVVKIEKNSEFGLQN